jgi:uncharacterized membrane protein (UPF0182 family)
VVAVRRRPRRWILVLVAAFLLVLMTAGGVATFYTDMLWYQEVDKSSVFWGQIGARVNLGLITGIGTALIVGFNLYLAERFSRRYRLTAVPNAPIRALPDAELESTLIGAMQVSTAAATSYLHTI